MKLKRLPPTEVTVPDQLWADRSLCEWAKLLWCVLRGFRKHRTEFNQRTLCQITGVSPNTLRKAIHELEEKGWLRRYTTQRRSQVYEALSRQGKAITLPTDLLLAPNLLHAAKWILGLIRRRKGRFNYKYLMESAGYSRNSLTKYVRQLQEVGWLEGTASRVARRKEFQLTWTNPAHRKRQMEIGHMRARISNAANQAGNSLGQALVFEAVHLLVTPGTTVVLNGGINLLENPETGALLQYDLYLPEHRLALEFQGPQHARPTERYPDPGKYLAQVKRDQVKRDQSRAAEIQLHELWAQHLAIPYLRGLLGSVGVPLRPSLDEVWHLFEFLEQTMASYRTKARAG